MRQRGDSVTIAKRMTLPAFDSATAAPYLGVYYSDELNVFYEVLFGGSSLVLRHARHGAMNLVPLGNEEFGVDSRAVTRVRFGRAGKEIVGLGLRAFSWDAKTSFRKIRSP